MSFFCKNLCQYSNCHKNFSTLSALIVHIENEHLDFDPQNLEELEEKKPDFIPFSYILKFNPPHDLPPECSKNETSHLNQAVIQNLDDVETEVTMPFNNNYLRYDDIKEVRENKIEVGTRLKNERVSQIAKTNELFILDPTHKKPFICSMKGCDKRYKNVNGIKYHYKKQHERFIFTVKKTVSKHKLMKGERNDFHGIPLYRIPPPVPDLVYHQHACNVHQFEEKATSSNECFYENTLPTSDVLSSTQVPLLNNISSNYYNVTDINGDIEFFAGINSNYIPSAEKF